jgi:hypothetical protein
VLTAANISIKFGAKPLFENISAKLGDGKMTPLRRSMPVKPTRRQIDD